MRRPSGRGLGLRGGLILLAIVLLVVGWLYTSRRGGSLASEPAPADRSVLAAIPQGAMLVAVVDLRALRATELGKRFLGHGRNIAGLGEIQVLCGSDPMDGVDQLAVAIPAAGADAGFGVFAAGAFDAERLLSCAERIVTRRGGKPVRRRHDRFLVLRDASLALSSAELAVADGGPFVLAEPPYLQASLEAMTAAGQTADSNEAHRMLRDLVPKGVVVATVVLSQDQRRTLVAELRAQQQEDSPFGAVTAAALSIRLDQALHLQAVLRCEQVAACEAIAALVDSARKDEAETVAARVTGLARVLDATTVQARKKSVFLRVSMPLDEAVALVHDWTTLRRLGRVPSPLPSATSEREVEADAGSSTTGDARIDSPGEASAWPSGFARSHPPPAGSASARPVAPPAPPRPTGSARDMVEYR